MQYWVNINGKQSGPINRQQLADMVTDVQNTYVWHQGLENWLPITEVADLADIVAAANAKTAASVVTPAEEPAAAAENAEESKAEEPTAEPVEAKSEEPATETQAFEPISVTRPASMPEIPKSHFQQQQIQQPQQNAAAGNSQQKLPPTNLAWAILATILCFQITGIVAIIYSLKVTQHINMGNIEQARKASDKAAGWIIASIVVGILYTPVAMISAML